jgi:hypothetical protein
MNPTLTPSAPQLREALYVLSLAKRVPDAELLDDIVRRFPQFAGELTDFAIELALDELRGDQAAEAAEAAIDPSRVSPVVSRAMSRFQNRLYEVTQSETTAKEATIAPATAPLNPFANLNRHEFRGFAERIGASTVFVTKLRDRLIDPATMTAGFRRRVADELSAPIELVAAHFAAMGGASTGARQFYKADEKPSDAQRQSFAEAVRNSGLTDEQQRHLLSL